jgi:hypothetical protein
LAVWIATADDPTFTARALRCAGLRHRHLVSVAGVGDTPTGRMAWAPLPPGGPVPTRLPQALAAPLLAELTAALVFAAASDVEIAPPDAADLWLTEDSVVRFAGLLRPVPPGTTEADRCRALAGIWATWTGSSFEGPIPSTLAAWAAALDARCAVPHDPPVSVSPHAPPAPHGAAVPVTPLVAPDANARLASAPPSSLVGAPSASAPREVGGAIRPTPAAGPPPADRASGGARSSGTSSSPGPATAPPAASAPDPDPSATFFDEPGLSEEVAPLPAARRDEPELGSLRVSEDPEHDRPRAAARPRWPLLVLMGVLALGVIGIVATSYAPSQPAVTPTPAPAPAAPKPEAAETGIAVEPVDPAAPAAPPGPSAPPEAAPAPAPEAPRASAPAAACVRVAQAPNVGASGAARVAVEVCAESGAPVTLFHRPAGASQWSSVAMSLGGDQWSAEIPLDDRHTAGVEYYVVAAGGNTAGTSLRPLVALPGG